MKLHPRPNAFEIMVKAGLTDAQRAELYPMITELACAIDELEKELMDTEKARDTADLEWLRVTTQLKSELADAYKEISKPIEMRLLCPGRNLDGTPCGRLHIDEGEFATKPHHTHACQHCGEVWRPAIVPTVGVQFLPGFKNK